MKQILNILLFCTSVVLVQAQNKLVTAIKTKSKANDFLMFQFTGNGLAGKPDSINTKSLGRGANVYVMMNYPFKTNPHFSAAIGAGIGSNSIYFSKEEVYIAGSTTNVTFKNTSAINNFKKYKLTTAFLEAPVELRWAKTPTNMDKSFKIALGAKVGTLISAYTKGKTLQSSTGSTLGSYTDKIKSKNYFNSTRISLTARVGFGHFSLFAQYNVTGIFKENIAADMHPYGFGIAISGL